MCEELSCQIINTSALTQVWWRRGVVFITAVHFHSPKPKLRFCAGSNPARGVSEICDDKDV